MSRRRRLGVAAVAALFGGCGSGDPGADGATPARFAYAEPHMGTEVRVVVWASGPAEADAAAAAAFGVAARLDSLFSDYRDDSEVAALAREAGRGGGQGVSPELWSVLDDARAWTERTGGAFDVTVGPLTRLWRRAIRDGVPPDSVAWMQARERTGTDGLVLEPDARSVRLLRPGMSLDLGGIAKGFVAGVMLDTLAARGIDVALVDAGGDLALGRAPPGESGWAVEFPGGEVHRLARVGVATSGDRYQFLEMDGVRYSHILDPRTGRAIPRAPTVAVVAPDPMTADVLASALTVLDEEEGRRLVEGLAGVAVRVTGPAGAADSASWETEGFPRPPGGG